MEKQWDNGQGNLGISMVLRNNRAKYKIGRSAIVKA